MKNDFDKALQIRLEDRMDSLNYYSWYFNHLKINDEVDKSFRPEFLNRIDDILIFNSLNQDHLKEIVELQIEEMNDLLVSQDLVLKIDDKAKEWLLKKGFDSKFGARPMRRTLEKYIQNPLSEMIIQEKIKNGDIVSVSANDFGLEFKT